MLKGKAKPKVVDGKCKYQWQDTNWCKLPKRKRCEYCMYVADEMRIEIKNTEVTEDRIKKLTGDIQ